MRTISSFLLVTLSMWVNSANAGCTVGYSGATCYPSPNYSDRTTPIEHIVLHYTVGNDQSSLNTLTNPNSGVSSHYLVMRDGSLLQLVDEDKKAWHAGVSEWGSRSSLNSYSIGIEIVNDGSGSQSYLDSQYTHLKNLCNYLIATYNIKPFNIIGHQDIAPLRKSDPGSWFSWKRLSDENIGLWINPHQTEGDSGLTVGAQGDAVRDVQTKLSEYGYGYVSADGIYGPITQGVVKAFQAHFRQDKVDGRADASTIKTLDSLLRVKKQLDIC